MRTNEDTLVFANVVYRHGDRNINIPYPNDPYKDESHWPEGFGQLTKEGMRRQYRLGQYFRRRYNDLLGDRYSYKKIYVQSSDFDRTLMSAQANLAGLFAPSDDEKFHDEIPWRPIPVHTMPRKLDNIIAIENDVTFKDHLSKHCKENKEVQRIVSEHADEIAHWSKMSGVNIKKTSDMYWLYNTLDIEREQNKKLPEWAEKAIERGGLLESIANFDFTLYAGSLPLARIASGFLIKDILEHFYHKINSTLNPDRSIWFYSGHDYSIANALNSLGMFEEVHIPPYAASLHFELYKNSENIHYVQMYYRKLEEEHPPALNIPGYGDKCPLDKFVDFCRHILPDDFDCKFS